MNDDGHALKPLLTKEGWELLNSLPDYDEQEAFSLNTRLREHGHPAGTVAAALTQSRLRREARRKFGDFAARMLFTEDGLQQSTRLPVAARHAQRFRAAGVTHVADLGSGLGGDAMAMASLGLKVVAVEADEVTAAAATMNLLPFPEADVLHADAEDFMRAQAPLPAGWGLWLDPARRDPGAARTAQGSARRLWDPEAFSPPLSFVTELADAGLPLGVKLGPGIPHELIPAGCEAEWVSIDDEVVEVVLWFNGAARPGVRRAASVLRSPGSDGAAPRAAELTSPADFDTTDSGAGASETGASETGGAGAGVRVRGREGLTGILWEPDGAVIRAGLVADLAAELGGHLLDEHIAYFCSEDDSSSAQPGTTKTGTVNTGTAQAGSEGPGSALARGYRILEVLDFNVKRLRRWAQAEGVAALEIKKRGVDVAPEALRKQLLGGAKGRSGGNGQGQTGRAQNRKAPRSPGQRAASRTLVLIRIGEERVAAVVDPFPRSA